MFFFFAIDFRNYKQHTNVIGHGSGNYHLMEAKKKNTGGFSVIHSLTCMSTQKLIRGGRDSERDIKSQMNTELPVFINR